MNPAAPTTLRRSLSTPLLVLYGLGTMVGAGIYALTGEIAGIAGVWTPAAFALAAIVAGFTALSFGELAARHPLSAGEAAYLRAGFGRERLAQLGGALVALAGATSAAALSRAALGYLGDLVAVPQVLGLVVLVVGIGVVVSIGIRESVWVAAVLTVLEIGGVLLVTAVAALHLAGGDGGSGALATAPGRLPVAAVVSGAALGFYAFLGFEDMVNVAEEVRDPRRAIPRAIVIALLVTTALYVALALAAIGVVDPAELGRSDAPLTLIYARAAGPAPGLISGIAIAGMLNGVIIQMIMASRVLYGLAQQGSAPAWLGQVHPRTRTPLQATALVSTAVLGLALFFPLAGLARATSWITLALFCALNLALLRMKRRGDEAPPGPRVPAWVPVVGALLCAGLLLSELLA